MEIIENLENTITKTKDEFREIELENIASMKNSITKATENAIDKAADYIIKAMPIPDALKDILKDVKNAIKTKDFKNVLSVAVKSSIREGLEILGLSSKNIKDIYYLKDIAIKGGLIPAIKNGIEIWANNYLKNNIVGKHVCDFFYKLKDYILTNRFTEKITEFIDKLSFKKEKFFTKCGEWYDAYSAMDIEKISKISKNLNRNSDVLEQYKECNKENQIIQNMTKMIQNKNQKLSEAQLQLCKTI